MPSLSMMVSRSSCSSKSRFTWLITSLLLSAKLPRELSRGDRPSRANKCCAGRCVISAPGCGGPAAAHAACDVSRPCQAHVLHPQLVNRCFGGLHGCHPVWGFPARTDAGNGVCGLGAAELGLNPH